MRPRRSERTSAQLSLTTGNEDQVRASLSPAEAARNGPS